MGEMAKSVFTSDDRVQYCTQHSIRPHPLQTKLTEATVGGHPRAVMLGAPEALHLCSNLIKLIKGKRCLDVGLFTGASALAWALATPDDGEIVCLDIQRGDYDKVGGPIMAGSGLEKKIHIRVGPALASLEALLKEGEAGKFDFAFVDAAKEEYPAYYEAILKLLRPGGVMAIDNALMHGLVYAKGELSGPVAVVDGLNKAIQKDERVDASLLGMADGLHLVFKK